VGVAPPCCRQRFFPFSAQRSHGFPFRLFFAPHFFRRVRFDGGRWP